jgi:thiamine biosynthesis lipoprotein
MTVTLARTSWQALGTSVELMLSDGDSPTQARAIVERQLDEVDQACSRFRADSELMRVNASAGRAVRVNPLLAEAIEVALRAAELTDGDVDPTVGTALVLAGYDRDWQLLEQPGCDRRESVGDSGAHVPGLALGNSPAGVPGGATRVPRVRVAVRAGWEAIEFDRERATLRIPTRMSLDLGATATAWAADRAAAAVFEATGRGVLLSLGGDISTAGPAPANGWRIHVTDDHRSGPESPGQMISIAGGGLATSSTTVRRWRHQGQTMHHIIDPSIGAPVIGVWRTASVAAIDCADANIAATAAIVRSAQAPEWLAELGLPARLVGRDGDVLTVGSWPREAAGTMNPLIPASSRQAERA